MKSKLVILVLSVLTSYAQSEVALTNNVTIDKYGIRLVVCDNFYEATNTSSMAVKPQVEADHPLFLVLNNSSSNEASILFPRESRFAFELRSADGALMAKTPK